MGRRLHCDYRYTVLLSVILSQLAGSCQRKQEHAPADDAYPRHSPRGSQPYLRIHGGAGVRQRILRVCRATGSLSCRRSTLRTRCNGHRMAVCLALHNGPLVSALRTSALLVLLPLHPLPLARYRQACPPSRATDAPTAAARQRERLLTHREKLQPLQPQSPPMRARAQLVAHRRRGVNDTVRITHRLTRTRQHACPQVLHWYQEKAPPCSVTVCAAGRPSRPHHAPDAPRWQPAATTTMCARRTSSHRASTPSRRPSPGPRMRALSRPMPCSSRPGAPNSGSPWRRLQPVSTPSRSARRASPLSPCSRHSQERGPSSPPGGSSPVAHHGNAMPPPPQCKNRRGAPPHRTPRQAGLGALAPPVSNVPAANVRRVGRRIDPACLLGAGLFPAAARPGDSAAGRRARAGLQGDPSPLAVLAGSYPYDEAAYLNALNSRASSLMHNRAKGA